MVLLTVPSMAATAFSTFWSLLLTLSSFFRIVSSKVFMLPSMPPTFSFSVISCCSIFIILCSWSSWIFRNGLSCAQVTEAVPDALVAEVLLIVGCG